uniref:ribonuclease H n=1 Tax=Strigamia maritima TaxID=126957 RepID=T1IKG3_STRMM
MSYSGGSCFVRQDVPEVYIDGACEFNGLYGARGGIGVYWGPNDFRNVSEPLMGHQTNVRAEIQAAVRALGQARAGGLRALKILTDSVTRWINEWQKNGWRTSTGQQVENREDFEALLYMMVGMNVNWVYVPADSGNIGNDAADRLARDGVYINGACELNGQYGTRGGIGVYWGPDDPRNVSEPLMGRHQTTNRAEIQAAVRALGQARAGGLRALTILTDSQFLISSVTQWMDEWRQNGWITSTGQQIENREDFENLIRVSAGINVNWVHVTAHSGNIGNDGADQLARQGVFNNLYFSG